MSRPRSGVRGTGSETPLELIDRRRVNRCLRSGQERVTRRTGQVKRSRQRAHGLDMRSSPFAAFQGAHRVDREARNRRKFLLREARCLAERLELRPK